MTAANGAHFQSPTAEDRAYVKTMAAIGSAEKMPYFATMAVINGQNPFAIAGTYHWTSKKQ